MTKLAQLLRENLMAIGRRIEVLRAKDISDEFTLRLRQVTPGMLHLGNLHCFDYAIGHLPSQSPILEIGAFCGLSTNAIAYYKRKHGAPNAFITCDKWDYSFKGLTEKRIGSSAVSGRDWSRFVKENFLRSVSFFSGDNLPYALEVGSSEMFERWNKSEEVRDVFGRTVRLGGGLSFCFIDGNHEYGCVQEDFRNCDELLDVGGFVLFDDSGCYSGSAGVRLYIRELRETGVIGGRYELVMTNPNYLLRKRP